MYKDTPGLLEMMKKFPMSVDAGKRIAKIFQSILGAARDEDPEDVPNPWNIVYAALLNPAMTSREYVMSARQNLSRFKSRTTASALNKSGLASSDEEEGADDVSETSSDLDSILSFDSEIDPIDEKDWKKRTLRTVNEAHAPGPKGGKTDWEWLPGTDLSPAEVRKPNPAKFFLIRRHKVDVNRIDIREFTSIPGFDWDSAAQVAKLNKVRGQIIGRSDPNAEQKSGPWTLLEENTLLAIVQNTKAANKDIDWESVAAELKDTLKDRVQPKGSDCAISGEEKNGVWKQPMRAKKLAIERHGTLDRSSGAIRSQAVKYRDIWDLLRTMTQLPPKNLKKSKDEKDAGWAEPGPAVDGKPVKRRKSKKAAETNATNTAEATDNEQGESPKTLKKRVSPEMNSEAPAKRLKPTVESSENGHGSKIETEGQNEDVEIVDDSPSGVAESSATPPSSGESPNQSVQRSPLPASVARLPMLQPSRRAHHHLVLLHHLLYKSLAEDTKSRISRG